MKLNSPLFDRIRVRREDAERAPEPACARCEWPGCAEPATHKGPKGRDHDGEYWHFCLEHVRQYNQSYNYFSGMTPDEVMAWQKASVTGHRPTWKMGVNSAHSAGYRAERAYERGEFHFGNPFRVFGSDRRAGPDQDEDVRGRTVRNGERKALAALGLDVDASKTDIKARFKALAKRHHPDANGGDTSSEDKLRDIIAAYNYLKSAGLC